MDLYKYFNEEDEMYDMIKVNMPDTSWKLNSGQSDLENHLNIFSLVYFSLQYFKHYKINKEKQNTKWKNCINREKLV